ncbi:adenylyltransferase/cytidyltransferase family protein [Fusibacter bizertensis]
MSNQVKEYKTGLTVGKFAPLHQGHMMLIEKALLEVEKLIIIVYDSPAQTDIPLSVRAQWLRSIYPQVTVIEGWNVPTDEGWTEEIQQKHENFILELLRGEKIDAFYSSEAYGFRMSIALNCENKIVDLDRRTISITGTDIRSDPFRYRKFIHPIVYSDFITKVLFYGGTNNVVGKLVQTLSDIYKTSCVKHGVQYGHHDDRENHPSESQFESQMHNFVHKIEIATQDANKFLFIQSGLIEINLGSKNIHHHDHPQLNEIAAKHISQPDLIFVVRQEDDVKNRQIIGELKLRNMPYIYLTGSFETQLEHIDLILNKYNKFMNLIDLDI